MTPPLTHNSNIDHDTLWGPQVAHSKLELCQRRNVELQEQCHELEWESEVHASPSKPNAMPRI